MNNQNSYLNIRDCIHLAIPISHSLAVTNSVCHSLTPAVVKKISFIEYDFAGGKFIAERTVKRSKRFGEEAPLCLRDALDITANSISKC